MKRSALLSGTYVLIQLHSLKVESYLSTFRCEEFHWKPQFRYGYVSILRQAAKEKANVKEGVTFPRTLLGGGF